MMKKNSDSNEVTINATEQRNGFPLMPVKPLLKTSSSNSLFASLNTTPKTPGLYNSLGITPRTPKTPGLFDSLSTTPKTPGLFSSLSATPRTEALTPRVIGAPITPKLIPQSTPRHKYEVPMSPRCSTDIIPGEILTPTRARKNHHLTTTTGLVIDTEKSKYVPPSDDTLSAEILYNGPTYESILDDMFPSNADYLQNKRDVAIIKMKLEQETLQKQELEQKQLQEFQESYPEIAQKRITLFTRLSKLKNEIIDREIKNLSIKELKVEKDQCEHELHLIHISIHPELDPVDSQNTSLSTLHDKQDIIFKQILQLNDMIELNERKKLDKKFENDLDYINESIRLSLFNRDKCESELCLINRSINLKSVYSKPKVLPIIPVNWNEYKSTRTIGQLDEIGLRLPNIPIPKKKIQIPGKDFQMDEYKAIKHYDYEDEDEEEPDPLEIAIGNNVYSEIEPTMIPVILDEEGDEETKNDDEEEDKEDEDKEDKEDKITFRFNARDQNKLNKAKESMKKKLQLLQQKLSAEYSNFDSKYRLEFEKKIKISPLSEKIILKEYEKKLKQIYKNNKKLIELQKEENFAKYRIIEFELIKKIKHTDTLNQELYEYAKRGKIHSLDIRRKNAKEIKNTFERIRVLKMIDDELKQIK
jgi:hypothetical protein